MSTESRPATRDIDEAKLADYWQRNVRLVTGLLGIWAFVSYGCGILFADALNAVNLPFTGYPLGFWFAQQGSILVFVALVFTYVMLMNRIERESGLSD